MMIFATIFFIESTKSQHNSIFGVYSINWGKWVQQYRGKERRTIATGNVSAMALKMHFKEDSSCLTECPSLPGYGYSRYPGTRVPGFTPRVHVQKRVDTTVLKIHERGAPRQNTAAARACKMHKIYGMHGASLAVALPLALPLAATRMCVSPSGQPRHL